MKIWFFNHYAVPLSLFPLARTHEFARFLVAKGHEVRVFAASTVHNSMTNLIADKRRFFEDRVNGASYIYLKTSNYRGNGMRRMINMLQYALSLLRMADRFSPPDVIVATSVHPLACVAGIVLARKYRCACVVEIADLWPLSLIEFGLIKQNGALAKALYRLERWIFRKADSIIFTMEGGKDYINEQYGQSIDTEKVYYINNGVDLSTFSAQRTNWYSDEDLDSTRYFKVVYAGSLGTANSPECIVEAAKCLRDDGHDSIRFMIFGDGYLRKELELYCSKNSLSNVLFKGRVDKGYIPSILARSDLNVFTGRQLGLYKYGLSLNKLFDYMASGKPILSNVSCGYDMLQKYECGLTVDGDSARALADGILRFQQMSSESYNEYCRNAARAACDFDFSRLTDQLEHVLHKALRKAH